mmetsp:Transcript_122743/g.244162  ORF Transcript_122743/g.244162 Transcript_122743/m.244162 type:complete len:242 (-) Transcript_122743:117-842(-)
MACRGGYDPCHCANAKRSLLSSAETHCESSSMTSFAPSSTASSYSFCCCAASPWTPSPTISSYSCCVAASSLSPSSATSSYSFCRCAVKPAPSASKEVFVLKWKATSSPQLSVRTLRGERAVATTSGAKAGPITALKPNCSNFLSDPFCGPVFAFSFHTCFASPLALFKIFKAWMAADNGGTAAASPTISCCTRNPASTTARRCRMPSGGKPNGDAAEAWWGSVRIIVSAADAFSARERSL